MRARRIAAPIPFAIAPLPALAHHPMGGVAAATVWEAVASGVAHPVIGLDHLAFLLAAGALASLAPGRTGAVALLAFLVASLGGAALHLAGIGLGMVETFVALSVLLAGVALLAGPRLRARAGLAVAFAAAGLVHGHALAEAAAGSPVAAVAAYLLTLTAMQGAIGFGAMLAASRWGRLDGATPRRLAGAGTMAAGAVALAMAVLA